MNALLNHEGIKTLLRYNKGAEIAEEGTISRLAGAELIEYNASFRDENNIQRRFIDPEDLLLVGICDQVVDVPFAPVVDTNAPDGVGNIIRGRQDAKPALYFAKTWDEEDPSGKWIKAETRPLPVLQRPGAVIYAKVV